MEEIEQRKEPETLSDDALNDAQGGYELDRVLVSSIKSPRDPASGQPTGRRQSFTADSFSFGVERE